VQTWKWDEASTPPLPALHYATRHSDTRSWSPNFNLFSTFLLHISTHPDDPIRAASQCCLPWIFKLQCLRTSDSDTPRWIPALTTAMLSSTTRQASDPSGDNRLQGVHSIQPITLGSGYPWLAKFAVYGRQDVMLQGPVVPSVGISVTNVFIAKQTTFPRSESILTC